MSFKAQDLISRINGLKPNEAFLLYRLADHMNEGAGYSFPGLRLLQKETRLDERTIRYTLRNLESMGVISIYCEGRGKRTLYLLHIENWIDKEVIRVSAKARPTREEREQVLLARELEKKRREEGDKKKKPKKPDVIAPQEEEEEELTREILQERENEKNIRRQRALEVWGLV